MEVVNSVDIKISMAEQVDSDDDDDILGDLGIPHIAQLIIPAPSSTLIKTPRTDGGQRLAHLPPADQSHERNLQHMDEIGCGCSNVLNPADHMT